MKNTSHETTRFDERRSLTQTLLETLSERGFRPEFSEPARGRRAHVRRLVRGGALVLGAVVLAVLFLQSGLFVLDEPVAYLEIARGSVEVIPADIGGTSSRFTSIGAPQAIHAGAVVETRRADRATLALTSGPSVRLDRDSKVLFASGSAVVLERGTVYVDSNSGSGVEVRTSLGIVRDIGTQFEVRLEPAGDGETLRVRVREGSVYVEQEGDVHTAGVGDELALQADGTLTRGTHPVHGPSWDWILDTARMPEVSGRPLRELLDWAAREGGWQLRFADESTEEVTAATRLHGNLENLTVRQAVESALRSANLRYQLEGGVLLVASEL